MATPDITDLEQQQLERIANKEHVKFLADERLRKQLRDATMACVAARGFSATTTDHVAQYARVSTGTLFRLYPTKALLLKAAMREAESLLRHCAPADDDLRGETFHAQLKDLWYRATDNALANPNAFHYWRLYRTTPQDTEWGFPREMRLGPFHWFPLLMVQATDFNRWNELDGWMAISQWTAAVQFLLAPVLPYPRARPLPQPTPNQDEVLAHAFAALWKGLALDSELPRVRSAYI